MELVFFLCLLLAGYLIGQTVENRHYRSIQKRENELQNIPLIASKKVPDEFTPCTTRMVAGNVVISVDFFKRFVAALRNLVGGRISNYETLLDRGRREALLRMREEARSLGAGYVFNIKMETSSIYKSTKDSIGSIEVLAYGTAITPESNIADLKKTG